MGLNFTVHMTRLTGTDRAVRVVAVESATGDDITNRFLSFCERHHSLAREEDVVAAMREYGRNCYRR